MYRITEHTGHRHVYVPEDFPTLLDAKAYVHNHEREGTRYTISKVTHENNRRYYDNDLVDDMQH